MLWWFIQFFNQAIGEQRANAFIAYFKAKYGI